MTDLPDISWFRDPGLTEPTPLTVTPDGRVVGHLCEWDRAHIGFTGRTINPPREDDMRFFLTGATDVVGDDGEVMEISVGKLTMNTGHAPTDHATTATAASRHYDDTGTIAAVVNAGSDALGIWLAGAMLPGLDQLATRRFRSCGASGDWRQIGGQLRLVAALSVPVGGFPIPRSRVASGAPLSLVAAGALAPARSLASFSRRTDPTWQAPTPVVSDELVAAVEARLDARRAAGELSAAHAALVAELDDTPAVVAALLAALDDTPQAAAALLAALDEDVENLGGKLTELDELIAADDGSEAFKRHDIWDWLRYGGGAARIRWGTPSDWTRCNAMLRDEPGVGPESAKRLCAQAHKDVTGVWPGDKRNVG